MFEYHEYILTESTTSVFPRAHWHVGSIPQITKGLIIVLVFACSPSLSLCLSVFPQNPFFSPWLCAMWTKTNSAASPLHKRPVFSHLNSFPAFYELLNSTLCYTVWVGAPKVIITPPWCLLHCVCRVTKAVCVCFHVHTCEGKCVFCDGQMRGKSLCLFKWGMFNMCLCLCDTSPCRCCK